MHVDIPGVWVHAEGLNRVEVMRVVNGVRLQLRTIGIAMVGRRVQ